MEPSGESLIICISTASQSVSGLRREENPPGDLDRVPVRFPRAPNISDNGDGAAAGSAKGIVGGIINNEDPLGGDMGTNYRF